MLFDGYQNGYHFIDIYVRTCRYEIKDGKAFEWTKKGRRRVTVEYAQHQVNRWKEREARVLTSTPPTRRQMWYLVTGWLLIAVTACAAFWWLLR